MKKLLLLIGSIGLLAGCDMGTNDKVTCESTSTSAQGVIINTKYELEYKNDDVKKAKITYEYIEDTSYNTTDTDTIDDNTTDENTTTDNATTNKRTTETDEDTKDGVKTGTDGTTADDDDDNSDNGVVDGVVGNTIDDILAGITDTTLDITGLRSRQEDLRNQYADVEGITSSVDYDEDGHYTITYVIDFDKISDDDLQQFNISRDITTSKDIYASQGLTCKES